MAKNESKNLKTQRNGGPQKGVATVNPNWENLKNKLPSKKRKIEHAPSSSEKKNDTTKTNLLEARRVGSLEAKASTPSVHSSLNPINDDFSLTDTIAIDCEMVGVGFDGRKNALARVSLVNEFGNAVYDEYVKPLEFVSDYRTSISGIRAHNLKKAKDIWTVQKAVSEIIQDRTLVGHALHHDLKVLFLSHPKKDTRDTSAYSPLKSKAGRARALRDLAADVLGVKIQEHEHCSVEDARATMYIYQKYRKDWEKSIMRKLKTNVLEETKWTDWRHIKSNGILIGN